MPPNPPNKMRRFAPRDTSRKLDVYFTPILSPPGMFEHGFTSLACVFVIYIITQYFLKFCPKTCVDKRHALSFYRGIHPPPPAMIYATSVNKP